MYVHQEKLLNTKAYESGCHNLRQPGNGDARKWGENEEMKKKWRENEEMGREEMEIER